MWLSLLNSLRPRHALHRQKNEDRLRKEASKESAGGYESRPATSADVFEDLRASLSAKERKTSATDLPPIPGSRRATETEGRRCPSRGLAAAARAAADARPRPLPQRDPPHPREAANAAAARPREGAARRDAEGAREAARFQGGEVGRFWLSLLHTSKACYLIFAVTAAVVLTLGFTRIRRLEGCVTSSPRASPPSAIAISPAACGGCRAEGTDASRVLGLWRRARSRSARRSSTRRPLVDGAAQLDSWESAQRSRHSDEPNDVYLGAEAALGVLTPAQRRLGLRARAAGGTSAATAFATALAALLNNFFDENGALAARRRFFAISVIATGVLAGSRRSSRRARTEQCNSLLHEAQLPPHHLPLERRPPRRAAQPQAAADRVAGGRQGAVWHPRGPEGPPSDAREGDLADADRSASSWPPLIQEARRGPAWIELAAAAAVIHR